MPNGTTRLSGLKTRKVLKALRDSVSILRRQLSPEERRAAIAIIKRSTPVRTLVSRHTRELLRQIFQGREAIDGRRQPARWKTASFRLSAEEG